jgi:hypothetical protein
MPNTEELQKIEGILAALADTIKRQGDDWVAQIKDIREDLDKFEDRLDDHSDMIHSLIIWRDSNGSPGAEDRLREVERCSHEIAKEKLPERMNMAEADILSLHRIADSAMKAVIEESVNGTLDARSKTTIERIKAWGPIISAALAAVAIVLTAVL